MKTLFLLMKLVTINILLQAPATDAADQKDEAAE